MAAGLKVRAVTTISKLLAFFGVFCLLASVFVFRASAQTYTVSQGIQGNNQSVNDLVSAWRSSQYWTPFADYQIFQIATTSGSGISNHYIGAFHDGFDTFVWEIKTVTNNRESGRELIFLGVDNSFFLSNPYHYSIVGSGDGQMHSELMDQYNTHFVLIVFAFVFMIVFLFKSFRFNRSPYGR